MNTTFIVRDFSFLTGVILSVFVTDEIFFISLNGAVKVQLHRNKPDIYG